MIRQLRYLIEYGLIRVVAVLLSWLPLAASAWLVRRIADLIFPLLFKRRKIARDNLTIVFGDSMTPCQKEELLRASFRNTAASFLDLFLVDKIKRNADRLFDITGYGYLQEAFAKGRGVVLVISHLGSWELLSFLPFLRKEKWSVVVKAIKNPYLNKRIDELRRKMTVVPISKVGSIKQVLTELKHNNGVAILIDQWAGNEGLWGGFFGKVTSTTSIPARLARQTGCALIPAYCIRKDGGCYELQICPALHLPDQDQKTEEQITGELNRLLESQILKHPEQWSWMHRRWKSKPDHSRTPVTSTHPS